jgi:hypothetical protein
MGCWIETDSAARLVDGRRMTVPADVVSSVSHTSTLTLQGLFIS